MEGRKRSNGTGKVTMSLEAARNEPRIILDFIQFLKDFVASYKASVAPHEDKIILIQFSYPISP
jgi:hypothetical protein